MWNFPGNVELEFKDISRLWAWLDLRDIETCALWSRHVLPYAWRCRESWPEEREEKANTQKHLEMRVHVGASVPDRVPGSDFSSLWGSAPLLLFHETP